MKACVLIPAYNAGETLQSLLDSLLQQEHSIAVIDDGSQDVTPRIVTNHFRDKGVVLLRHPKNLGKGAALKTGLEWALREGFDIAATMDSDLQHSPLELPKLLTILEENNLDLLIGSRLHNAQKMPVLRRLGNRFSSWVASIFCHQVIFDSQSGYRLYRLQNCRKMIAELKENRFSCETEILLRASIQGLDIGFSPITVNYPDSRFHKSHYRPWRDTGRIVFLYVKELLRRLFTCIGREETKKLKSHVQSRSYRSGYYLLSGSGQRDSLVQIVSRNC